MHFFILKNWLRMKYLTLLILFNIGLWSACNSQDSAPASAVNAFKAKYPNVQNPKWEKESADEWEAEFKADGREMSAVFKSDGTWLESETEIKAEDLPKAVQEGIATEFSGYEIEEAEAVERPGMALAYEVELEKGEKTVEALFDADGALIKKSADDDEEDEEDDDH